ncbi:stage II sporulation protein M [Nocardia sp. CNY236]|uniref:stage II sporulation protein M n=1 Tax=Nocardia sp. CNY236 TaxID=1169152 RepID=UPI00068787D7|nr:stage II sporulation protein M [Nocardia sp. CNY236]
MASLYTHPALPATEQPSTGPVGVGMETRSLSPRTTVPLRPLSFRERLDLPFALIQRNIRAVVGLVVVSVVAAETVIVLATTVPWNAWLRTNRWAVVPVLIGETTSYRRSVARAKLLSTGTKSSSIILWITQRTLLVPLALPLLALPTAGAWIFRTHRWPVIVPTVYVLYLNALNLGVTAGLMADAGRIDAYLGFILPHGMLEMTAILVGGGVGLKLGWTLIDPGRLSRSEALAKIGRSAAIVSAGLVGMLLISGLIEGFVTPSSLPLWARLATGFVAEATFLLYVFGLGRRAKLEETSWSSRTMRPRHEIMS